MKTAKAAGTTLTRHFLLPQIPDIVHGKHYRSAAYEITRTITDEDLADYFIFTVTRNPWDRVVSNVFYFKSDYRNIDAYLEGLVSWDFPNPVIKDHAEPIYQYAYMDNKRFVDFIIRFEHLQEDVDRLCEIIGLKKTLLKKANTSSHDHYTKYYTRDEQIQTVADVYSRDIEAFGYRYGEII